jgi:hypothetical protein
LLHLQCFLRYLGSSCRWKRSTTNVG